MQRSISPEDVSDYLEITQLRHAYCHYVDSHEYEAWADLFTEDGVFDTGDGDPFEGRREIHELGTDVMDEQYEYSAHLVMNPLVSINGDEATGQWYYYMQFTRANGTVGWHQGRYDEAYRRVDGTWMFDRVEAELHASQSREAHVTF